MKCSAYSISLAIPQPFPLLVGTNRSIVTGNDFCWRIFENMYRIFVPALDCKEWNQWCWLVMEVN